MPQIHTGIELYIFFWLRSPNNNNTNKALVANPGNNVNNNKVNNNASVVPAWP